VRAQRFVALYNFSAPQTHQTVTSSLRNSYEVYDRYREASLQINYEVYDRYREASLQINYEVQDHYREAIGQTSTSCVYTFLNLSVTRIVTMVVLSERSSGTTSV
jgi:hypothetical protein